MAAGTILLPYDGTPPSDALLRLACSAVGSRTQPIALFPSRVPASLPPRGLPLSSDEGGNETRMGAELLTSGEDVAVETWPAHTRRSGDVLLDVARRHRVRAYLPACARLALAAPPAVVYLRRHRSGGAAASALSGTPAAHEGRLMAVRRNCLWLQPRTDEPQRLAIRHARTG